MKVEIRWLFADGVSCMTLNRLVRETEPVSFERAGAVPPPENELVVMRSGEAQLVTPSGYKEQLTPGSHFGATALAHNAHRGTEVRFLDPAEAYRVPLDCIVNVPVVRWKIIETHRRRYEDF